MAVNKVDTRRILFEDNHLFIYNKAVSEIVQGDKTGDVSLDKSIKTYIKDRDNKPGNVYLGIPHRLDRPVSGIIVYAKTSKALERMNAIFRDRKLSKLYHAVVANKPEKPAGELQHYLKKNEKQNKSYPVKADIAGSKEARLAYRVLGTSDRYYLLEVDLFTGRHHQIRAQLAAMGCPVKGDLKYGAPRSNRNKGISLHARYLEFIHPVRNEKLSITAPYPESDIFEVFER